MNKKYDLEERTLNFATNVLDLCKTLSKDTITEIMIKQLVRSSTSIGANYSEANGSTSKKDFRHRIYICKRESVETNYWLKLLLHISIKDRGKIKPLILESRELVLIFGKIVNTLNNNHNS